MSGKTPEPPADTGRSLAGQDYLAFLPAPPLPLPPASALSPPHSVPVTTRKRLEDFLSTAWPSVTSLGRPGVAPGGWCEGLGIFEAIGFKQEQRTLV